MIKSRKARLAGLVTRKVEMKNADVRKYEETRTVETPRCRLEDNNTVRRRQHDSPKRWYLHRSLSGVTTQKNNVIIVTAIKALNLTILKLMLKK
jgi:hypothetical protein